MRKYKNIVWDWNGTLLDDVNIGHDALRQMLERRNMGTITLEEYKDQFGFPVRAFYESLGFDFERYDWHEISLDFVNTYDALADGVALTGGARKVLENLQQSGVNQYILSALNEESLHKMVLDFEINSCFCSVCGSDNIYADGKIPRGQRMIAACGINPEETLMIGDTLHDAEVAEALGFSFLLYSGGHNSKWRLQEKGDVIDRMEEILKK